MIKTLIIGIIFTSSIFAVKSGIGMSYLLQKNGKYKILFILMIYFFLFVINFYLIKYFDFIKHFNIFEGFLKKGILIHFILAIGMFLWGVNVLLNSKKDTKAYLLLTMPCPFCFLVILLSIGFLYKFVGNYSFKYTLYFFVGFSFAQLITAFIIKLFKLNPENFLGISLIFIGFYFLMTYILAPVFSGINRVYQISSYGLSLNLNFYKKNLVYFLIFLTIFLAGVLNYLFLKRKRL